MQMVLQFHWSVFALRLPSNQSTLQLNVAIFHEAFPTHRIWLVTFTLPVTCHMPTGFTLVSISLPTNCFCESSLFSFTCSHCNKFSTSPLVSKLKIKLPQVHCWSHSHLLQVTFIWTLDVFLTGEMCSHLQPIIYTGPMSLGSLGLVQQRLIHTWPAFIFHHCPIAQVFGVAMTVWRSSYSLMHWALDLGFWSHVSWTHILARMSVCTLPRKRANFGQWLQFQTYLRPLFYTTTGWLCLHQHPTISYWANVAVQHCAIVHLMESWSHCDLYVYLLRRWASVSGTLDTSVEFS